MHVKQTVVGHTKQLFSISVLVLVVVVASVLFITFGKPSSAFAACAAGTTQGIATNAQQNNAAKCYDANNNIVGNADGTPLTPTTTPGQTPATAQSGTTTCAIQRVGWILCPIITESGRISDYAFSMLAENFLETEPELIATSANGVQVSGTQSAWNQARNLANIMFIIVFLIIIMSQLTGYGVSNYGIKKMIPRLVIAAIAVNLSYYICQILVDLTNILGFALEDMLVQAGNTISQQSAMPIDSVSWAQKGGFDNGSGGGGNVLTTIAAIAVAGAAIYPLLGLLFASIGMILFTCIAIIFILLMRKAIIILLVVASPIAFVLYLLPNTEKMFSKWLHMFWQLLLVFPIVGMLIGGGQLASKIILVAGAQQTQAQTSATSPQCVTLSAQGQSVAGTCKPGAVSMSLGLVAAGVAVAPLLATYAVLKGALNSAGAIGGKISGAVQGVSGRLGKATQGRLDKTAIGRGIAQRNAIKADYGNRAYADKLASKGRFRGRYTKLAARGIAGNLGAAANWVDGEMGDTHPAWAKVLTAPVSGSMQAQDSKLAANAAAIAADSEKKEIAAEHLTVNKLDTSAATGEAEKLINGGNFDSPRLAALLEHIAQLDKEQFIKTTQLLLQKNQGKESLATRSAGGAMRDMGGWYGAGDAAIMSNGGGFRDAAGNAQTLDLAGKLQKNLEGGSMSAKNASGLSSDDIGFLKKFTGASDPLGEYTAHHSATARSQINEAYKRMSDEQKGSMGVGKHNDLGTIL